MDEQYYKELYDTLVEKQNNPEIEWQDVVDMRLKYGLTDTRDTVRKGAKFFYEFLDAGWEIIPPSEKSRNSNSVVKCTTTINADKSETSERQFYIEDESKLRDYNYLLKLHNYDPRYFEVVSARNSKWNSGNSTLYSSKVVVKPKTPTIDNEILGQWFKDLDRVYSKTDINDLPVDYESGDDMLILPISDLHFALRASKLETGNEYNCEIAENLLYEVIRDVMHRVKDKKLSKILFTIGGDMSNFDNIAGTTTKGTEQDNACGYFDMIERLFCITIGAIDMLANIAPVEVVLINGNHDKTVGYSLAQFCYAWYRNDKRVNVDVSPLPRKYIVFGKTLFVFAHDGDLKRLPHLIPDEAREYWAQVNMTEVFLQHLHDEMILIEQNHMRIQRLPTISGHSSWTKEQGFCSKRQCKSFIFNKDIGLTDVLYTNVD